MIRNYARSRGGEKMRYFITAKGERVQTLFSSRAKSVGKLIWASGVLIWPRIKSQEATVTS